jgi:hypothetical protein
VASGRVVDVETASTRELAAAVKELRTASPSGRGKTTTPDERARAQSLQKALRAAGLTRAHVRAVAFKPGQGADLAITGVPMARAALLGKRLVGWADDSPALMNGFTSAQADFCSLSASRSLRRRARVESQDSSRGQVSWGASRPISRSMWPKGSSR